MKKPKHRIHFSSAASKKGESPWLCACGYIYPEAPEGIAGTPQVFEWLDPQIAEHEKEQP